jgi:hypothetical protein
MAAASRSSRLVEYSFSEAAFRKKFVENDEVCFSGPGVKVHITGIQGRHAKHLFVHLAETDQQRIEGTLDHDEFISRTDSLLVEIFNRTLLPIAKAFKWFDATGTLEFEVDCEACNLTITSYYSALKIRAHTQYLVTARQEVIDMLAREKMPSLSLAPQQKLFLTDVPYEKLRNGHLPFPRGIKYEPGLEGSVQISSDKQIRLCEKALQ